MKLIDYVKKIIDMDDPMLEANIKLKQTLCLIDGKLRWINSLGDKTNTVELLDPTGEKKGEVIKVTSLHPFVPEAGIYPLQTGGVLMITRNPKKQYAKSWSRTSHTPKFVYSRSSYFNKNTGFREGNDFVETLQQLVGQKPRNILVDIDRIIWFWDIEIGYISNSKELVCTNSNFTQELRDWSRDA